MSQKDAAFVIQAAQPQDAPIVARLWWDAFTGKLRHVLGAGGPAFLEEWLVRDPAVYAGTYLAWSGGRAVGYIQISGPPRAMLSHLAPLSAMLRKAYGIRGMIKRLAQFAIGEIGNLFIGSGLYIAMLGVVAECRGQGVGSKLLSFAEEQAAAQGKTALTLGVVGENTGAIRLYERYGFTKGKLRHSRLFGWAYGSDSYYVMTKRGVRQPTE